MVRCAVVVLCYVHKQEVFISRRSREVRAMLLSQAVVPEVPNPEGNSILTYPATSFPSLYKAYRRFVMEALTGRVLCLVW